MKAVIYYKAHAISDFQMAEVELPSPVPGNGDLLIRVKAISVNPVDCKVRRSRDGANGKPVILGWDAAGEVVEVGPGATGFASGDRVFYAGELLRDGCYAELQVVDSRIVARMPGSADFAHAAALPLTSITAWEAMFESMRIREAVQPVVLVWGGAGGVGSIALQLLKACTDARVVTTASRPETVAWCRDMGADAIIDHRKEPVTALRAIGMPQLDFIFSTTGSAAVHDMAYEMLRPFGHWALIDDPPSLDIVSFKRKSLSVHWEYMFAKTMFDRQAESQGQILREVAALVDQGRIRSTMNYTLHGLSVETVREAHNLLESGTSIGKTVIVL